MPNQYPSIVINKFDKNLYKKPITCPFCDSRKITIVHTLSTMLGLDYYNHKWKTCKCNKCNSDFVFETKSGEGWYTKDNFVLKGLPNCFENYILSCKCGGKIHRFYYDLNQQPAKILSYSNGCQQFYTIYKCDLCGSEESLDKDGVLNANNSRTE